MMAGAWAEDGQGARASAGEGERLLLLPLVVVRWRLDRAAGFRPEARLLLSRWRAGPASAASASRLIRLDRTMQELTGRHPSVKDRYKRAFPRALR